VRRLILAFVEIALHRRGPEDLPASGFFFAIVLALYLPVAWLNLHVSPIEIEHPALWVVVDTALGLAFVWTLLRAFRHESRFRQTAGALLGADTILNLLNIPPTLWYGAQLEAQRDTAIPLLVLVLLGIWTVDIAGFVLSRALGRPYVLAVAIMLGYVLLAFSFRVTFFPPINLPATN
jgi:hypothetical protein